MSRPVVVADAATAVSTSSVALVLTASRAL
jgi:hypothetical protein